jgi:hypothetical protein
MVAIICPTNVGGSGTRGRQAAHRARGPGCARSRRRLREEDVTVSKLSGVTLEQIEPLRASLCAVRLRIQSIRGRYTVESPSLCARGRKRCSSNPGIIGHELSYVKRLLWRWSHMRNEDVSRGSARASPSRSVDRSSSDHGIGPAIVLSHGAARGWGAGPLPERTSLP